MYPSRDTGQENLGLSPGERRTLQQLNKQLPSRRSSNDPHAVVEEFLLTIPLDAETQTFLSDVGSRTLLSIGLDQIDKWQRERNTVRIAEIYTAATAVLWAEISVRLALGEIISVGGSPVDPDLLALIDVGPCSTETLIQAKAAYVEIATKGQNANKS